MPTQLSNGSPDLESLSRKRFLKPGPESINERILPEPNGTAMLYLRTLNRHARDLGVQMLLNTKAERLIFEDGKVQGISVIDKNKRQRLIRAKAVLIATGALPETFPWRMRYDPRLDGNIRSTADPNGTGYDSASGDGILMAEATVRKPRIWMRYSSFRFRAAAFLTTSEATSSLIHPEKDLWMKALKYDLSRKRF